MGRTVPSTTPGRSWICPAANMAHWSGSITASKRSTPNIPRLLTVTATGPENSWVKRPSRAKDVARRTVSASSSKLSLAGQGTVATIRLSRDATARPTSPRPSSR